jgi:uncharacterized Zn finger protein
MNIKDNKYLISNELNSINEREIALLDQENLNGQGWDYYCNGQITMATVFNNRISGVIKELSDEFQVEISADENEISSNCSCGFKGGVCDHVVALLYSWVNDREDFVNIGTLVRRLQNKDKQELIEILERIFENSPRNVRFINPIENENAEVDNDFFDI